MGNKKLIINILLIFITMNCSSQSKTELKQGVYDEGQLEVLISNNFFYGYININQEINCKMFFWGKLKDNSDSISIYNPIDKSINRGSLTYIDKKITIKSNEVLFPCQRIIDLKQGWPFFYTNKTNWENCTFDFVKQEKSFLYSKPNQMTKKKSYLLKNDVVLVFEKKGQWLKIKYIKNDKTFFWIKNNDLFGLTRLSEDSHEK